MLVCIVNSNYGDGIIADCTEYLIKKGADVNEKNILGDTPLKLAQTNGNEELALKLIKIYKADIN